MQECAYHACVRMHARKHMCVNSVGCASDWRTSYYRFALQVHHSNVEIEHDNFFHTYVLATTVRKNKKANFEHQNYFLR